MAAVDAAGIERFHLAGYSLGTSIAIHIAAHHPQRVRRMVPPMHARALADAIPNAHYAELASGHLAPFEQAEAYARLLLDFLAQEE